MTIGDQMIALKEENETLWKLADEVDTLKGRLATTPSISIKPGVDISGIQPEMALALPIIATVYAEFGVECVITSSKDGKHGRNSLHYVGFALDFRTRDLSHDDQLKLQKILCERLQVQFDVVLEKDHLHVEFQPEGLGR